MLAAFRLWRLRQAVKRQPEDLAAQKQCRAHGLVLRAGRDAAFHREVCEKVAHRFPIDARPDGALLLGRVVEHASDPVHVAALGAIRVVAGADAGAQRFQNESGSTRPSQSIRAPERVTCQSVRFRKLTK